jgi:ABC-type Fe3+ transport system permease subunit
MANISGYSELRTLKDIVIPLTSDDYVAGWMHIYVSSVREVTIPLLLYAAGSEVLGVELLYLLVRGVYKSASTIGVVLTILSVIPYLFLQYYRANNLDRDTQ